MKIKKPQGLHPVQLPGHQCFQATDILLSFHAQTGRQPTGLTRKDLRRLKRMHGAGHICRPLWGRLVPKAVTLSGAPSRQVVEDTPAQDPCVSLTQATVASAALSVRTEDRCYAGETYNPPVPPARGSKRAPSTERSRKDKFLCPPHTRQLSLHSVFGRRFP